MGPDRREALILDHFLRITLRCLTGDINCRREDAYRPVEDLDHEVCKAFIAKRSQSPVGTDKVQPLNSNVQVYTLHAGRWRGVTWHDQEEDIVWLLGCRFHRSGEREDAYPFFKDLDAAERLLPTEEDYLIHFDLQERELPARLQEVAQEILERARRRRGEELREVIGGTFPVSVVVERENELEQVWVAVSQRLLGGEIQPPPEWLRFIVAAFFPDAPFDALQSPSEGFPTRAVGPDEIVFSAVSDY